MGKKLSVNSLPALIEGGLVVSKGVVYAGTGAGFMCN